MWNLLCQYNNIYADSYKYLKGKKKKKNRWKIEEKTKKKKNYSYCSYSATWTNQSGTIATVQNLGGKKGSLHQKGHCRGIASSYIVSRKKSTNRWLGKKKKNTYWTNQKYCNFYTFTDSPNKCHNIFIKHLFSVVVGHSFNFYYFILTYKKLTRQ